MVISNDQFKTSSARWWVLFVYNFAEAMQGLMWMSYSSVPQASKDFLHVNDSMLNWILNLGPISFVLCSAGAAHILNRPGGLRSAMLIGASMLFTSSVLRCIPPFFYSPDQRAEDHTGLLWWVLIAQFINAAAATLFEPAPALLSQTWFPPHERALATGLARAGNAGGRAIGFLLGPAMVSSAVDMPLFLYVHVFAASILIISAIAYYPPAPPSPPSRSAQVFGAGAAGVTETGSENQSHLESGLIGGLLGSEEREHDDE